MYSNSLTSAAAPLGRSNPIVMVQMVSVADGDTTDSPFRDRVINCALPFATVKN